MSFSSKSKDNLARIRNEGRSTQKAEIAGIIRMSGAIEIKGFNNINVRIVTENSAVARLLFILFKKNYKLQVEIYVKKNATLKKNNSYEVFVENALGILKDLHIIVMENGLMQINKSVPVDLFKGEEDLRAYLRGCYLGGGSLSDPDKNYHLEIITHDEEYASDLSKLLNDKYELNSKYIKRKKNYIVYMKESNKISDFLNIIGAHSTMFLFEDVKIIKEVRNNVNRVVNCETANLSKTVSAAYEQVKKINFVKETYGLDNMDPKLSEIAYLRLEYPEYSLKELSELTDPPISKSGVNHRLKKIEALYNEIESRRRKK